MNKRKEYIPVQHAHVTQQSGGVWIIKENITRKILGELPSKLNESEVFNVLSLIRKYELEAFNKGINFGKRKSEEVFKPQLTQMKENFKRAINENERLADALDKEQKKNINIKK